MEQTLANHNAPPPSRSSGRFGSAAGARLAAAFDAVSNLPALAEARRRLLGACTGDGSLTELADAIESDAGLAIAVMRAANNGSGAGARVGGVPEAIADLKPEGVHKVASGIETYDVLERPVAWVRHYEAFRRHAVLVRLAADRIAELANVPQRDELAIAALLHDVGKLVLVELHGDASVGAAHERIPEERVRAERRELGLDHAVVGAVLIRRWGLKAQIAAAVERHHATDAAGHAAAIRLADMVAHQAVADPVAVEKLREVADVLGLGTTHLGDLLYEFPHSATERRRASEPCPLSVREIDALKGLADGKVYKQIADELALSVSTVRTHLHNVYRKIGAVDRAQAVLIARDRGWL